MEFIADLLLIAAALGAAFYCFILSRRLSTLNSAEGGIGTAIATLSEQVERLEKTLDASRHSAEDVEQRLLATVQQAETLERDLAATLKSVPSPRPMAAVPAQVQRAETQPAAFRRRLFSDAASEKDT